MHTSSQMCVGEYDWLYFETYVLKCKLPHTAAHDSCLNKLTKFELLQRQLALCKNGLFESTMENNKNMPATFYKANS